MRNPIKWLQDRRKKPVELPPLLSSEEDSAIRESVAAISAPVPPKPKQPRGRVIKNTKQVAFNPNTTRRGGRVVRAMPRELQKIKEAQEAPVEDD